MHIIEREAGDIDKLHRLVRAERDAEQRDRLRVAALTRTRFVGHVRIVNSALMAGAAYNLLRMTNLAAT